MSDLASSSTPPASVELPAAVPSAGTKSGAAYDAFISYSHALDKPIAAALQSAMQRLGKAWHQRRALRLFRDDTSLTATPHLWPSIEEALGKARFLILLASPEAAASRWVDKELAWWLDHNGPDTVLIALTAGELAWDVAAGDFRWSEATPLPPVLRGRFADEPRWIDLRPYREAVRPRDARFTDLAADFAAVLHGRAKEDLLSQEVRQQRRALRLAGAAVALLLVLLGLAGWQWTVANAQRNRAEHDLALATQTANGLVFNLAQKFRNSSVPVAIIAEILSQAKGLQEQLVGGGETSPALHYSQAGALMETSETLLTIGDTADALAAATEGRTILAALVAAAPDNADYRRELSVAYNHVGDALWKQRNLKDALAAFHEGLAIIERLTAQNPNNPRWQRDLMVSESKFASLLIAQGDIDGAIAIRRAIIPVVERLAQQNPGDAGSQRDLAISEENLGDALAHKDDVNGALAAYRAEQRVIEELVRKDAGNTQWEHDLAMCDSRIGGALRAQGDLPGALAALREEQKILSALVRTDTENTEWQHDLAEADEIIGIVLWARGDTSGTFAAHRESLAVRKALAAKDPSNVQWQTDLAANLVEVAIAGDDPKANLTEALGILKHLDADGKLTPEQKGWIAMIEARLDTLEK